MYIACDIGGSKTRVAKSIDGINFEEPIIYDSPHSYSEGLKVLKENTDILTLGENITAFVAGVPGVLDSTRSIMLQAGHQLDWIGKNVREDFKKIFETEIYIENDAALVGLGEAVVGAGKDFESVVYITVSTGIGGCKIVNHKFEINRFGFEPGHQILNAETKETFEDLASGTTTEKKFGLHPKEVAKTMPEVWDKIENYIAIGIHNSILHWSPDVVVIGGSMAKDLNAERMTTKIKSIMKMFPNLPEIKIAELGSIGGIHGGFAYLRLNRK
jgi:predicted NBD/HSP70 family sugar kinase